MLREWFQDLSITKIAIITVGICCRYQWQANMKLGFYVTSSHSQSGLFRLSGVLWRLENSVPVSGFIWIICEKKNFRAASLQNCSSLIYSNASTVISTDHPFLYELSALKSLMKPTNHIFALQSAECGVKRTRSMRIYVHLFGTFLKQVG